MFAAVPALLNHVCFLLALTFLYGLAVPRFKTLSTRAQQIVQGTLFGLFGVLNMLNPFTIVPGVMIDARWIIILMAGLFGGFGPGLIAAALICLYRIWLGGAGTIPAVGSALTTALLGALIARYRLQHDFPLTPFRLAGIGVLVAVIILVWLTLLPQALFGQIVFATLIPVTLLFVPGAALLGTLLEYQRRRLELEEALAEEQYFVRTLIEAIPVSIYGKDREHRFTFGNAELLRKLKLTRLDQVMGKTDFDFLDADQAAGYRATEDAIVATGEPQIDFEERYFDRQEKRFLWSVSTKVPQRNRRGEIVGILGINRDVTRFKLAEAKFRALLESAPDAMIVADQAGRIVLVNGQTEKLFGYARSELLNQPVEILAPELQRERHAGLRATYTANPQIRGMGAGRELFAMRRDGSLFPAEISLSPIESEEGLLIAAAVRNVTERKYAEAQLAREQDLVNTLVRNIPDAIYFKDKESRFIRVNQAQAQLLGMADPELVVGKTDFDFYAQEYARKSFEDERAILETGVPIINQEALLSWPDRPPVWVSATRMPLYDASGAAIGTFGVFRDITRGKQTIEQLMQAEARLSESEARYRTLVEMSPYAIVISSLVDHKIRYFNLRAATALKLDDKDAIGMSAVDFYPNPDDRKRLLQAISEQGEIHDLELLMYDLKGRRIWTSMSARTMVYNDEPALFATFKDMSERRAMEEKLRVSEELYRSILHASPDDVTITDLEGRIQIVSPSGLKLFGYEPTESVVGRPVFEWIAPENKALVAEQFEQLLRAGSTGGARPYAVLRKDGTQVDVEVNGEVIRDAEGRPHGVVLIIRDVTERKQAESQSFALAIERERVKILAGFIENVSHEFRTPLSVIGSSIYLLQRAGDDDKRRYHAEKATEQIRDIGRLIDMLLSMTMLDSGAPLACRVVDLGDAVRGAERAVMAKAERRRITLHTQVPAESVHVWAEAERLFTAFDQLLDNAVRYTLPGGSIDVCVSVQQGAALIEVADTGVGIDDEALPHIFERFWRQDHAHTTPGFGLGLTLAQRIVRAHEGRIEVESSVDRGTTFRVFLPLYHGQSNA